MTSLNDNLREVMDALKNAISPDMVFHYRRPLGHPPSYLVWAENGEDDSFNADNLKREQVIGYTADYYTQTEFDPNVDRIQTCLDSFGRPWHLISVSYEDETNLIHYEWGFENG